MIDPKTLHIGAHVMVNGVRARVIRIDEPKDEHEIPHCTLLRFKAFIDGKWRDCGCSADADKVEPIPITEELLKELGFEKVSFSSNAYEREFGDEYFMQTMRCTILDGRWNVAYYDDDNIHEYIHCQYLHELEQFAYKTTKTELIKE